MDRLQRLFRILDIPPEIRKLIYEDVFTGTTLNLSYPTQIPFPVLITSKQIYNEAITVFYATVTFYFAAHETGRRWFVHLPAKFQSAVATLRYDTAGAFAPVRGSPAYKWSTLHLKNFFKEDLEQAGATLRPGALQVSIGWMYRLDGKVVWTNDPRASIQAYLWYASGKSTHLI